MKKLSLLTVSASIGLLLSCSPSVFQEKEIQPGLSLVAPNGVRLANSMEEFLANTKSAIENKHGSGSIYTITKITYGGVAPFEEEAIKAGAAVAKVDYKTSKGEEDNFIYVNPPKSGLD